jgi:hypothetical protein
MAILRGLTQATYRAIRWTAMWTLKILFAPFKMIYLIVRGFLLGILRSPVATYRTIVRFRNWGLAKVEYLQSESAKWKTTFQILKSPYSLLRTMGFSPQMAVSFLVAGSAVGGGVVVNETVFAEKSFARGDSGVYSAPLDTPQMWSETFNTLRVDLGTTSVKEISITDVSIGSVYTGSALPSGATTAIDIGGNQAQSTYLEVGHFIFENNRCTQLLLRDVHAHTLKITGNASDGQSIAPTAGTSRMRAVIGGHHQAQAMTTMGGTYDRLLIDAPSSSVNGKIQKLVIRNAYSKGGLCYLHRIKAGTLEILSNEIGGDQNLEEKDFTVETSVTGSVITLGDNVEVSMAQPATVTADS